MVIFIFIKDEDVAKHKHCISPQKYFPSTVVEQITRFNNIGFGYGLRSSNEIRGN